MAEQLELEGMTIEAEAETEVVEEQAEERAPFDLTGRLVKVWAQVTHLDGAKFSVQNVYDAALGIQFVKDLRELGIKCGYTWKFKGEKMSTPAQMRILYAIARAKGYRKPGERQADAASA